VGVDDEVGVGVLVDGTRVWVTDGDGIDVGVFVGGIGVCVTLGKGV
jgi:hypothetical protein